MKLWCEPETSHTDEYVCPYMKLRFIDAQNFGHLFIQETFTRAIGLKPSSIDDQLRNGTFAGTPDDLLGSTRSRFDIDFFVGDIVLRQEAFGDAAIGAPEGGVQGYLHL